MRDLKMMTESINTSIKRRLGAADKLLITSHIRPDGDAIGSLLGLGLALQNAGKDVQMVLPDGVPAAFSHLEGSELIQKEVEGVIDTFIVVDCGDFDRVHEILRSLGTPAINIDHHITNDNFAEINLVETDSVATASILAEHLDQWGLEISKPVAAALMTGLITDTLGFRTMNMNPKAFRQAATLMEKGIDLPDLYYQAMVSRSYKAVRYWGAGLSNIERDGTMVWATLSLEDRKAAGYFGNDDADLINILSSVEKSPVAIIFVEQPEGAVKISWRVRGEEWDVAKVAADFGGGGHRAAAGATIKGSLDEIKQRVLRATREILSE
ncbi:MAG: DHH family phosphoesterase [Anaerolineae bacterium]|nr:DHH family phosphoesterase [Anaerolineae bacterium]